MACIFGHCSRPPPVAAAPPRPACQETITISTPTSTRPHQAAAKPFPRWTRSTKHACLEGMVWRGCPSSHDRPLAHDQLIEPMLHILRLVVPGPLGPERTSHRLARNLSLVETTQHGSLRRQGEAVDASGRDQNSLIKRRRTLRCRIIGEV